MSKGPFTLFAALFAALALLLSACGGGDETSDAPAAEATASTAAADADAGGDADAGEESGEEGESEEEREEENKAAASESCDSVGDITGDPDKAFPSDIPLPGDAHVYASEGPFGKTTRFFAAIDGDPDALPTVRDDAADVLVENGFELLSKDQEEGAEAEAHLSGPHTVDIQVINLCEGKLRIRYTVA